MKILLVEDEKKTASYLQRGLEENGFVVDVAEDGEDGLHHALTGEYDLLILDVMLPRRDGYSIVAELRRSGKNTLTMFLTARDELADRVKGLDLGGDAYLGKPFAFSEFMAQVRTLLRRGQTRVQDVFRISDLELDLTQHRASRNGMRLDLRPKEFKLLELLTRRAGEVLSRATIAESVWNMNFDSDTNVVDVHIRRLRAKVDVPFEKKLIQTVRGMGYVLREADE
jgi:two-component system, OmpR family, copper resistance phosphate regulon response regulator CusR